MAFHCDRVDATCAQVDLDFFWHMMLHVNLLGAQHRALEEEHEEFVDDGTALFMCGNEL